MPRRNLHNPDDDDRPAYGLRDDDFDDRLREETATRELREQAQLDRRRRGRLRDDKNEPDDQDDDGEAYDDEQLGQLPWRAANRVTNTEVALFLGAALLRRPEITSNVNCFLSGYELTRSVRRFDVESFLTRKFGFLPKQQAKGAWRGNYSIEGIRHKLVLKYSKLDPCITVRVRGRNRLVCFVAGGRIVSDGHAEKGILRDLAGRAVNWEHATWSDFFLACVPRSETFRKAIAAGRNANGRQRLRLVYLMVERTTGTVIDLEPVLNVESVELY